MGRREPTPSGGCAGCCVGLAPAPGVPRPARAPGCRIAAHIGAASRPRSSSSRAVATGPSRSPGDGGRASWCTSARTSSWGLPLHCGPYHGSDHPARPAEGFPGRGQHSAAQHWASAGPRLPRPLLPCDGVPAAFRKVPSRWRRGSREQSAWFVRPRPAGHEWTTGTGRGRALLSLLTPSFSLTLSPPQARNY